MKNHIFSGIILLLMALPVLSQNQTPQKEDLRKVVLQLSPGSNNPRNSEGDFITLKDGRILFIYSRYTGSLSYCAGGQSQHTNVSLIRQKDLYKNKKAGKNN